MKFNKNTVHMLWIGGEISTLEKLCINSFKKNGHEVVLHAYQEVHGAPSGIEIADANKILSESNVFSNTGEGIGKGGFAGFSDWFRYELLKKHPGWWCDTDMVCLKHFDFEQECVIATSRELQWGTPALGCAMRLSTDDPLLDYCLNFCRNNNIKELVRDSYIAAGPGLLQRGIRDLNLHHYEVSPDTFCPISWRHTRFIVSRPIERKIYNLKRFVKGGERVEKIKPVSKGLHLWHSTWKLGNIDQNKSHNSTSVYEYLKNKYLS